MEGDGMKETLKLALEALWTTANPKAEEAITAIEAALAQPTSGDYALGYAEGFNDACKPKPAQEPDHGDELTIAYMSGVHRGKELAAQPAQEPFAVLFQDGSFVKYAELEFVPEKSGQSVQILFTTPQQRPWVGLTKADQKEIERQSVYVDGAIRMTEAKLKELNQ